MIPVFDSNIIIDYLKNERKAATEFELYSQKRISLISWIEVLTGALEEEMGVLEQFLSQQFTVLPITKIIARRAIDIRKEKRLKLPDAIILATAECENTLLVTRNTKDFSAEHPSIRVPYTI